MSAKYENSKIYKIYNILNAEIYIGSTCQTLSQRMSKHRYTARENPDCMVLTNKMNLWGIENFYIELLEEYPCDNIEQLNKKEGEWIRKLGTLNSKIQGRTPSEHYKEVREKNN